MRVAASPESTMTTEPHIYIRKVIEGWFLDEHIIDIKRDNFFSWCSWAFLGKDIKVRQ
jgi:hypothetical protein